MIAKIGPNQYQPCVSNQVASERERVIPEVSAVYRVLFG